MANSDWLPSKEADLANFLVPFSAKITATPTAYSLTAPDATALATLVTAFLAALAAVNNPATSTPTAQTTKEVAKASVIADVRSLARRIQANPAVTWQKTDLGLPIHDAVPTPTPPPSTQPVLALTDIGPRTHTIRLADILTPTRRSKPVGTVGAEIYAWAGPTPPADLEDWNFKGIASKAEYDVPYAADDVGKLATIVARWFNRKGEVGPVSDPITGTIAA